MATTNRTYVAYFVPVRLSHYWGSDNYISLISLRKIPFIPLPDLSSTEPP